MKHAAAKEKIAEKIVRRNETIAEKPVKKVKKLGDNLPLEAKKIEAVKKISAPVQKLSFKEKPVKATINDSKSKTTTAKATPVVSGGKTVSKAKKSAANAGEAQLKIEQKSAPATTVKKNKLPKDSLISAKSAQAIEAPTQKSETFTQTANISTATHKIAAAINVGKINAALKAIEEAQLRTSQAEGKEKKEKKKSDAKARRLEIAEAETKAAAAQTKPKTAKQIGAAVFRGRKNRYDFQVFPLDFAFENVPAIYVISKRKTDSKKRAHHALVCIGQTDSIAGELEKHTQSKCVIRHEANVISILPEQSEKKRLKIEEDLKAAHALVCNVE